MRPSGHVSSHSEKSARLHCWTRLQESNVQCNVAEGHLHSQHENQKIILEHLSVGELLHSAADPSLRCLLPMQVSCDGSIHMHWSDPSQSGSPSHNTLLVQGPGMSRPSSGHTVRVR